MQYMRHRLKGRLRAYFLTRRKHGLSLVLRK
jgi:hypothetical protein